MLEKLIIKSIINMMDEKTRKARARKKLKKKKHKKTMIQMFGKTRYALSYWFGMWVLFIGNTKKKAIECNQQPSSNVIYLSEYKLHSSIVGK